MSIASTIAERARRAGVRRAFVADGAEPAVADAIRAAGIPIVEVARGGAACVMAAVTGRLGDGPGLVLLAAEDLAAHEALDAAARERAPLVVVAPDPCETLPVARFLRCAEDPPTGSDLERVLQTIAGATRPLIVAGRGCRAPEVGTWLRAFAEALPAPVLVTPAGRGALPDPHPLCHGLLAGDVAILRRADLVLALGVDDDEIAAASAVPTVRVNHVGALLEELAPRLRDHARADWDVAELDRLRRARPAPDVDPALAALVTRLRDATPAGTAAIFARKLEPATRLWQAVQPADVLVEDDVVPASVAVALARPEALVLVFAILSAEEPAIAARAGVRVIAPTAATLGAAIAVEVERTDPRVLVVPLAG